MYYKSKLWQFFWLFQPATFLLLAMISLIDPLFLRPVEGWLYTVICAYMWAQAYWLGSYFTALAIPPTKLILFPKPWYPDGTAFGLVFHTLASNVFSLRLAEGKWSLGPARDKRAMLCRMESLLAEAHKTIAVDKNDFSLTEQMLGDIIVEIMDFSAGFSLNVGGCVEARIARMKVEMDEAMVPAGPERLPPQGLNDV